MTPQDKLNHQRKATFEQHTQSGDFSFMDGSQESEDCYTLGFVTACMWLTEQEMERMKTELRKREETNLVTQN